MWYDVNMVDSVLTPKDNKTSDADNKPAAASSSSNGNKPASDTAAPSAQTASGLSRSPGDKDKVVVENKSRTADELRQNAERIVANIVKAMGLSPEVAEHAINAASGVAVALGSMVNVEAVAFKETSKVAGIPGLANASLADLGKLPLQAANQTQQQSTEIARIAN